MPKTKKEKRIVCNQCVMVSIQGVPCHETGCPNTHSVWIDGVWVKMNECPECGNSYDTVDEANACCGM